MLPRLSRVFAMFVLMSVGAVACVSFGSGPHGNPSADDSEPSREALQIGQDTKVDGWIVLPEWSGVWVAGGGALFEIDQGTGEPRQASRGPWDYDYVDLARHGEGTILLASGTTLWEIDARSGSIQKRLDLESLGSLDSVIQAGNRTWVAASTEDLGVLAQIDLDTGDVLERVDVGQGRHELVWSAGYLVVGSQDRERASILRVDPRTGATTPIEEGPGSIAAVGSRLWVASDGEVRCRDLIDLTSCGLVRIPRAASLASSDARLWVLSSTGSTSSSIYEPDPSQPATVTLVDGVSGDIVAGPLALPSFTPATISAFRGHAWVGFHDEGRVLRIDCQTGSCHVQGRGAQST